MALLYSAAWWVIFPHSTGFRLFYIHEHISFLPLQAYECLSAHHPRVKPFSQPLRGPFIFPILLVCSVIWDLDKLLPTAGQPLPPPPPAVAAFPEPVVDLSPMEIDFFSHVISANQLPCHQHFLFMTYQKAANGSLMARKRWRRTPQSRLVPAKGGLWEMWPWGKEKQRKMNHNDLVR